MKRIFCIFALLITLAATAKADTWLNYGYNSSEGTEFYVTFMHNNAQITSTTKLFQLFMATRQNTHVMIYRTGNSQALVANFYLNGDTVWRYQNTDEVYLDQSDAKFNSVKVVTDQPITLYTSNSDSYVGDASFVLPKNRLGKEYIVQTPGDYNVGAAEFAIIATENNTTVNITPSYDIPRGSGSTWPSGTQYTVTLNQGQVYYATTTDYVGTLTGTKICADKKVALFNGCQSSQLTGGVSTTSHLYHQAVPIDLYGTRFAFANFANTTKNIVLVTAAYDGTQVYVNGSLQTTLNKCQSYKYTMTGSATSAYLNTSKPCIAYQYIPGRYGSPSMGLLPSLDQGIYSLKLTTFKYAVSLTSYPYVNIVLPDSVVSGMMLDNTNISSQFSAVTGLSGYSYACVPMTDGPHELYNSLGKFNAMAYSISGEDADTVISYAFNAGMNCTSQIANFLLNGQPVDSIGVCQDVDYKGRFTATSIIPGDYQYVRWYDEYGNTMTLKSSDSIWNGELEGVGLHTVWMKVTRTTPVCNNLVTDNVIGYVRVNPRYDNVELPIQQVCQDQRIKIWDDSISCDTLPENVVLSYPKTFQTIYGCDSTVIARIKKIYPRDSTYYVSICQGQTYTFHGRQYNTSGTYPVLDSLGSCKYTETLVLTVNPVYLIEESASVCSDHLPYEWHGQQLTGAPGVHTFYDYLTTKKGCDSTYKMTLTINPAYFIVDTVERCDNDLPYRWHGRDFNQSGIYFDSLTTSKGCDSIHKLVFTVHPTFFHVDTMTMCSNDSAHWRGRCFYGNLVLNQSGDGSCSATTVQAGDYVFFDSLLTYRMCDSVYKLVLKVMPSYVFKESQTICDYDTITWRGKKYNKAAGIYVIFNQLKTEAGCDSIYRLDLKVNQSYSVTVERTICQGGTYQFDQQDWTWRNMIVGHHDTTVHYRSVGDCDSSFRLLLTVNPVYHFDLYDTVCNNQTYHWTHGAIDSLIHESVAGNYQYDHHFNTVDGCDSSFTLNLLVKDTIYVPTVTNIPDYGSYTWNGKVYAGEKFTGTYDYSLPVRKKPYTYTQRYQRTNGCDSLISLTITVDSSYQRSLTRVTCRGVDYDFNGTPWSWKKDVVGSHDTTYEYQTTLGYDSSWTIHLTVNEVYNYEEEDSVCVNDDYVWQNHGKSWFAGQLALGTHVLYDSLKTINNCDSVYKLTLTVLDTFGTYTTANIPDQGYCTWDGKIYAGVKYTGPHDTVLQVRAEPYIFRHEYKSRYGCDSVLQIKIQVDSSYQRSKSITICQHDDYDFNGVIWTWKKDEVGVHDTLCEYQSVLGYDSSWHLTLTVNPVYYYRSADDMCVNGVYDWIGHNRQISGLTAGVHTIYDSLLTAENCDSIYELTLTVKDTVLVPTVTGIPDNGSVVWNGKRYAGEKYVGAADVVLPVRDDDPYFFRDTLTQVNGCDSFITLTLQVDSSYQKTRRITICQHDTYVFNGTPWTWKKDVVGVHDTLYEYQSVLGYDSTWHLILTVNPVYYIPEADDMCVNRVYDWVGHNRQISGLPTGVYTIYDSLRTTKDCDSIYELTLTVNDTIYVPTITGIPDNGSIVWNGKRYAGEKYAGVADTVLPVRDEDPYIFRDTLTQVNGCDSFIMLSLQVDSSYQKTRRITICQHDTYDFNGTPWTWKKDEVGVHDTLYEYQSVLGYDSTWHLILTVNPVYFTPQADDACINEPYEWIGHGKTFSGLDVGVHVLYDSLSTTKGCDSVYELTLTVLDTVLVPSYASIPDNGSYTWNGKVYAGEKYSGSKDVTLPVQDNPYFFRDTLTRVNGCDSFRTLSIQVDSSYQKVRRITICQHDVYDFNGKPWTWKKDEVGAHDTLYEYTSVLGYDSTWHLYLTVNPVYYYEETDVMCDNDTLLWHGRALSPDPGVYVIFDSLQTVNSCDSVYKLTLTVKDTVLVPTATGIPDNGSYTWNGKVYAGEKFTGHKDVVLPVKDTPYFFRDTLTRVNGCDSFRTLTIQVDSSYQKSRSITICQHDSYLFNGEIWTWKKDEVGVHDTLCEYQSVLGYDSSWHVTLTVNPVYLIPYSDASCVNHSYEWRGKSYTGYTPGVHILYDSLQTGKGCDSVYQMTLTVIDTTVTPISNTICDNNMMGWLGTSIAGDKYRGLADTVVTAGVHTFRKVLTSSVTGCDSMIYLTLTVLGTFEDSASVSTPQYKNYKLNGSDWTWKKDEAGVHDTTYIFKNWQGLDSVWHLHLVVHPAYIFKENDQMCRNEAYEWRGKHWDSKLPGVYVIYDSLLTIYGADSVYQLTLTVNDTTEAIHYLSICDNDTVTWDGEYIRGNKVADTTGSVYQAREYPYLIEHFYKTTVTQCDSVEKLWLTVYPTYSFHEDTALCARDGFMWRDRRLTTNGTHTDEYKSVNGCDSIYSITINMDLSTFTQQNVNLCEGETFSFRGRELGAGVYYDTINSTQGCDSIIMIVVNELPSYYYRQSAQICQGDVYQWHGQNITNAGVHFDHNQTQGGCDSTYELTLTVIPEFHDVAYDTVCLSVGDNYHWRGKEFSSSGIYYDSIKTSDGCDSVYELRLTLWRSHIIDDYIEICEGDSFDFRGRIVQETGIYFDSLLTRHGCDSIYRLIFNVTRTYHFNDTVQICDGETYNWRGRDVQHAGTYRDSFTTVGSGCDSIYELLLVVKPKYHWIEYDTVCSNVTYHWREKYFTQSGIYFDSLRTSDGCDSVYELRLTVNPSYLLEQTEYVCEGESFDFRGKPLTLPGVYYDTLISSHGCDSIYKLTFNVMKTYHYYDTTQICDGSSYSWHGRDLTSQGIYYDSLKTFNSGCDSIYELYLIVKPKYHWIEYDTVCSNVSYHWRNKYFTESGVYFDSLHTYDGCDSVYELRLTVNHSYLYEQSVNICQGGSYNFRGKDLSAAGIYYDSLISSHGCDSVFKIVVNVQPTYHYYDTTQICRGEIYQWRGRTLQFAGTYRDTLLSAAGCDSIYELYLKVADTYYYIEYDTVCTNQTYSWHGSDYTKTGVYYDSLKSTQGCDSVYELRLTVNPNYLYEQTVNICEGGSYNFRGRNLSAAGIYYDSLISSHGCDSVYKIVVNVHPIYHYYDTATVCRGNTYSWRGRTISLAGTHYDSLSSVSGCDSIYELYLKVADTYYYIEYDTVCTNQTYSWHGRDYTKTGVYYDSLRSTQGCDSVYELRLTVNPNYLYEQTVNICEGGSYNFRGRNLSAAGIYYDSLISSHGCDSVYKIVVNVHPTYHYYDTATVCRGNTYSWRGRTISLAGTHYDSLKSVSGCDSIYELYLKVADTYYYIEYDTLCTNQTYSWHGRDLDRSGVYFDSLKSTEGCDSVYELRLTINPAYLNETTINICQGNSYDFRGRMVTEAGVYYDSLISSHGCDSVYKIVVNVNPTYQFYDTAQICDGSSYSWRGRTLTTAGNHYDTLKTVTGCDSIYQIYLMVMPKHHFIEYDTVCSNNTYHWRNKDLTLSGTYFDSLTTLAGCDSVYELRLTINPAYLNETTINICQGNSYDFRGRMVTEAGVYYDSLISSHGCDSVYKIVVNVNPTYQFYDTAQICDGSSYSWRGRTLTTAGNHYDTLKTVIGCDSIYQIYLKVMPKHHFIEYDTVCSNYTYHWRNKDLTLSGTYFDSLTTLAGCDSVYELRLTVNPSYVIESMVTICQGESFDFRGMDISTAGIYYDTLKSSHGCDSIFKIVVNVTPTFHYYDTAQICDGGTYSWRGLTLTKAGNHYDSLRTVNGCDSIYELYLRVMPKFHSIEYDTVCSNKTYHWRNKDLTASGTYYDSLTSLAGCDSVYELRLTVNPSYVIENMVTICQGQTFDFRGKTLSAAGVYYDTLITSHGCDSIFKLVVNVNPTYHFYDSTSICRGSSYSWRGKILTTAGSHYDSLRSVNGCDSVYEIFIRYKDSYHFVETDTVCTNATYRWHGMDLNASGTYYDSLLTADGCDSLYELHLTLCPSYLIVQTVDLCQGNVYYYRDNKIQSAGIYYDSLKTSMGCDSIIKYVVNVHPTFHFTESVVICDGDTFPWHGQAVTNAGTYYDRQNTVNGCDSVYELNVTKGYKFHDVKYDTICQNTTYHWRNQYVDTAGVYYDSIKTALGCDSVYELRLEMYPNETDVIYHEICEGDTFVYGGKMLTSDGMYVDTSVTAHGCQKITKLYLSVAHPLHTYHTDSICQGETYDFYGTQVSAAGTYQKCLATSAAGCCETIQHLTLIVRPSYKFMPDIVALCSDTGYVWRGKMFTESGTYYDSLKTKSGCDSVYELQLTLNHSVIKFHYDSICEGESMWFRKGWLTESGTYDDTLRTTYGCDSIYRLVLNVKRTTRMLITRDICRGDAYNFRGRVISQAGTYFDTVWNGRCMDSIYILTVAVHDEFYRLESDTICRGMMYNWHGRDIATAGTYFDSVRTLWGCDSVFELRLTVDTPRIQYLYDTICFGGSYTINNKVYSEPGVYYDTLTRGSKLCDSLIRFELTVKPQIVVDEGYDEICAGDTFWYHNTAYMNGGTLWFVKPGVGKDCDTSFKKTLYVKPLFYEIRDTSVCQDDSIWFFGTQVYTSGTYIHTEYDRLGCDSVYEWHVTVNPVQRDTINLTVCANSPYVTPTGKVLRTTGTYVDTLVTHRNCDSIVTYIVVQQTNFQIMDTLPLCKGGSVIGSLGHVFTQPGDYRDTINLRPGVDCDTIYFAHVYWGKIVTNMTPVICHGDTFNFRGKDYTKTGVYTVNVASQGGGICDSTYIINLTVNPIATTVISDSTCDNQPYMFFGKWLTQTGVYRDSSLKTTLGCDSIIELHLKVNAKLTMPTDSVTMCETDQYVWHGKTYNQSGIYNTTDTDATTGCRRYWTLVLTVIKETHLIGMSDVEVCQDDEEYYIVPKYSGTQPTAYTVRYDGVMAPSTNDVVNMAYDGTGISMPIPLDKNGKKVRPDRYTVTMQIFNDQCVSGSEEVTFTLLVKYPNTVLEQHFQDVVSVLNYNYNGGYHFEEYRWYVNGSKVTGALKSNLYDETLQPGDSVYAELRRVGDGYFIPTCPLLIENLGADDRDYPVIIGPYPISVDRTYLRQTDNTTLVRAQEAATYRVSTTSGIILQSGAIDKGDEIQLSLPYIPGCYFLMFDAETAGSKVFKIIVH